jgi:hypothetical protein
VKEWKNRNRNKKTRYGTAYERMTSPGREAMREYILTPKKNGEKPKSIVIPSNCVNVYICIEEEVKKPIKNGNGLNSRMNKYIASFEDSRDGSFVRNSLRSSKNESSKEVEIEFNVDYKGMFERETKAMGGDTSKISVDKSLIYLSGPITSYIESPAIIPLWSMLDPSKISVTKVVCGWDHCIVLLENNTVYVCGNNAQGQLNYDPVTKPSFKDGFIYHPINEEYEVFDVG